MSEEPLTIRKATSADAAIIHEFICELAAYEDALESVEATAETLHVQLSAARPPFEALIAEIGGDPVGFALFFANYSTWTGRPGIYLEDLFVPESNRGKGIGSALLAELSRVSLGRGGARLDWQVLDWNEPSIRYYESLDAKVLRSWLPCRLEGAALTTMAQR
ncbi:MAG: GNAT family N-acetyltransferase [Acidimicrobiales bacterium]